MKNRSNIVAFMLGVVATLLLYLALGIQPPRQAEAQTLASAKWEYTVVNGTGASGMLTKSDLNKAGDAGWELAHITGVTSVIMKRRK